MPKSILFLLIANLACKTVDYWALVGVEFIHKCFYAQSWAIVWNTGLDGQVVGALSILSYCLVASLPRATFRRNMASN